MHILYLFVRVLSGCLPACLAGWLSAVRTRACTYSCMQAWMDGWMDAIVRCSDCAAAAADPRFLPLLFGCVSHAWGLQGFLACCGWALSVPGSLGLTACMVHLEVRTEGSRRLPKKRKMLQHAKNPNTFGPECFESHEYFFFGNQGSPHVLRVMNIFVFGNQGSPHVMRVMNIFVFGNQGSPPVLRVMSIFVFGNQGSPLA